MSEDGKSAIRPMTPEERSEWSKRRAESAMRERFMSEMTGEGQPRIVIRLFPGEAHALSVLLATFDISDPTSEAGHLWHAIGHQIEAQWGNRPVD